MISKPILFSGPMVRAILEGRKTQTRRVVKPQPVGGDRIIYDTFSEEFVVGRMRDSENAWTKLRPRFEVGSEMWVRETWGHRGGIAQCGAAEDRYYDAWIEYKADRTTATIRRGFDDRSGLPKMVCRCQKGGPDEHGLECQKFWASWRPSIFMPRWASRITLEVTDVRVQRLQDISDPDAKAEGVKPPDFGHSEYDAGSDWTYRDGYASLWESINGPGSWDANPWVWVYTFDKAGGRDAR